MTDTLNREPVKAIESTTEHTFLHYDQASGTWTPIHVLTAGHDADVLAAWIP